MSSPSISLAPEITPAETYQIDSEEYDSDQEKDDLEDDEYDRLVEEAENGYSEDQMKIFTDQLKETGLVNFLRDYLSYEENGQMRSLRKLLLGFGIIPLRNPSLPNLHLLPFTKIALSRVLRRRTRLSQYSTLDDALNLIMNSKKIMILSGAGISTSCGIPDFRSSTGLYSKLQQEGKYNLDDPQQMFDIGYFKENPQVFYSFAKQIYPSNFIPSPCHRWIKMLEDRGILLRNYTQNIDTLESLAGVEKVLQCHGSFKTASCLRCKKRVPGKDIESYIMEQRVPLCSKCQMQREAEISLKRTMRNNKKKGKAQYYEEWYNGESDEEEFWGKGEPGIMKPDITFFGQALDSEFDECLFKDREQVDLLIIIGTSLKVAPVSEVLTHIPHSVPQIYINLTPVHHVHPDICLLGDADSIVTYLSSKLGWSIPPPVIPNSSSSSKNGHNGDIKNDERIIRATQVSIPPEEGEWVSGVNEAAHIHRYQSKTVLNQVSDILVHSNSSPALVDVNDLESQPKDKIDSLIPIEPLNLDEAKDGYESDNDNSDDGRPSKRSKRD